MKEYTLTPFQQQKNIQVTVPGSKSITNRALLLAALAKGTTTLQGVLFSDDSRVFMEALKSLGYTLSIQEEEKCVQITSPGEKIPLSQASVYVGSAGTAARFLTAMLALSGGQYEVTSSEQMKGRPMKPLLLALEQLGVEFEYREAPYHFPFYIKGRQEKEVERVDLNIDESSQFLSALLLAGVMCRDGLEIHLTGQRDARSYVEISMKMMKEFGCSMEQVEKDVYKVLPGQHYEARSYQIEPDVSAACYFYAMAAINGGTAQVMHVHRDSSQGDIQFLKVLEKMGCHCEDTPEGIVLTGAGAGKLQGIHVNMSDFSDQTMTLAAVSVFAAGETVITCVGHIRKQDSDRIKAIATELNRMGIACQERDDGLLIRPDEDLLTEYRDGKRTVTFETYEDHRMAMAFAVIGTKLQGITIDDPLCCRKTFENYFQVLTNLGLSSKINK